MFNMHLGEVKAVCAIKNFRDLCIFVICVLAQCNRLCRKLEVQARQKNKMWMCVWFLLLCVGELVDIQA